MKYEKICIGKFRVRPNRFVAYVEIEGEDCKVHVKNTGRCRELLREGATVFLEDFYGRMNSRKLRYSIIGVKKKTSEGSILINMDSQAPNKVVREALEQGRLLPKGLVDAAFIKAEYTYGESRLDFYVKDSLGKEVLIEVKGVTLEEGGIAGFPDAPTERGIKHVQELIRAGENGLEACMVFVVQMKGVKCFMPNDKTHRAFGDALREADRRGVEILAYDCCVDVDQLVLDSPVEVIL